MKFIELTKGKRAIVDDADYEWLSQWKWLYLSGYAARFKRKNGNQEVKLIHREIMKAPKRKQVDHRNMNCLDNRRNNLRICTFSQNMRNRKKQKSGTSIYKGVSLNKKSGSWETSIRFDGKRVHIGSFNNEYYAGLAYDLWAVDIYGEFARTNFIQAGKRN